MWGPAFFPSSFGRGMIPLRVFPSRSASIEAVKRPPRGGRTRILRAHPCFSGSAEPDPP